ncbi:Bacterial type II secretion system protein F domain protein [Actinomadura rubteroloni]|uniref:Bacterial type II secretion system protein F domain protein n=1 Tax=Actinomadura rubteroloni TaxID=1926885 RepID=A0A2P4UN60_9ACTN|nr:type II secretion system F family protein [Actinomadura rubteroloni]POM26483.1 Bacterial type II secretion system protein F domain protein [Actinomadura rubteroloni]
MIVLVMICMAAAAWTLLGPRPAVLRLARTLGHEPGFGEFAEAARARVAAVRDRRREPERWRAAVIELCDAMAAELTVGRTPGDAYAAAVAGLDPCVARRLPTSGSDPPFARLERVAASPGAEGLRLLAACWRIGAERGGTLGSVLDGLAKALRDELAQRREVATQLAGPRATARLLAALPLLGLAMAAGMGADPLGFLFGSLPGGACLVLGVSLDAAGLWWTRRLARGAEEVR